MLDLQDVLDSVCLAYVRSYVEEIVDIADPNLSEFNAIFTRFKVCL